MDRSERKRTKSTAEAMENKLQMMKTRTTMRKKTQQEKPHKGETMTAIVRLATSKAMMSWMQTGKPNRQIQF